eukprot:scaffold3494_cov62-Phaeocystis_antarctica.AAC.2
MNKGQRTHTHMVYRHTHITHQYYVPSEVYSGRHSHAALDSSSRSANAFGPYPHRPRRRLGRRTPGLAVAVRYAHQSSGCQVQAPLSQTGKRRLPASSQTRAAP